MSAHSTRTVMPECADGRKAALQEWQPCCANITVMSSESRRRFLAHVWLAALAPAAARLPDLTPAQRRRSAVFPDGVAAVPTPRGVVLTTRLAPSDVGAASVTWAVARDRGMRDVVAGGRSAARSQEQWVVQVDAPPLPAGTPYWFQFRVLGVTSTVGRIDLEVSHAST